MSKRNGTSSDGIPDAAFVARFQEGDRSAFDGLVLRYQDKVFRTCLRFLADYDEAADCAQDIFVRVYGALGGFRKESNFSTWLYRVAVNACKNRTSSLQYKRRNRMISLDEAGDPDGKRLEVKNGRWSPHLAFEKNETKEAVKRAIRGLPEEQRTVVILRDIENLPYDEIARITGLAQGTVKSKLFRARKRLAEELRELR
ncbi:MAG: sigma-70 family RNA polymerase sigma factor [Spirochaetes bacterium]|nr:sigma-70 family RNA polymerase sigma factor [Spirochaetota bacterium]